MERDLRLGAAARLTLAWYETEAEEAAAEEAADPREAHHAAIRRLLPDRRLSVLDLGCGTGLDLALFAEAGHDATGLEGSPRLAAAARSRSGATVLHQDLMALDLPAARFDLVFANRSLHHVPRRPLPRVLRELRAALRDDGHLFVCARRGRDEEGLSGGRYGVYHTPDGFTAVARDAGFTTVDSYLHPSHLDPQERSYFAALFRRT